jgi:hypothetical protein
MFFTPTRDNSLKRSASTGWWLPDDVLSLRFVRWQMTFDLISRDESSWRATWDGFLATYLSLLSSQSDLSCKVDPVAHAINIDVMRLARHFPALGDRSGECIRRMERILRVFSNCSSPNGYQQGYHELLFPFFLVGMYGGPRLGLSADGVEAIVYFLLHSLVNGTTVGDFFLRESDELTKVCDDALNVLRVRDHHLATAIQSNGVSLVLCTYSWVITLFTQIYHIDELLLVWDFLFADVRRIRDTVRDLVVAHLMSLRRRLAGKGFAQIMSEFRDLEIKSQAEPIRLCKQITRGTTRRATI